MIITKADRKRKRRRQIIFRIVATIAFFTVLVLLIMVGLKGASHLLSGGKEEAKEEMLLSINPVTRPGTPMQNPVKIIVRRGSETDTSAEEMRNRLERAELLNEFLDSPVSESAHYVIGINGEAMLVVPLEEEIPGNTDCIVLEYCQDSEGNVPDVIVNRVNSLLKQLKTKYGITNDRIISK